MPRPQERALSLHIIGRAIEGHILGNSKTKISGVGSLEEARPGDLAYVASDRFIKQALYSKATAFVVSRAIAELKRPQIVVPSPPCAFARIVERFFCAPYKARGIADRVIQGRNVRIGSHPSIWPFVTIGDRVTIGQRVTLYPGVFLGDDSTVGDDSVLYPNVTVQQGCVIGRRVVIHSGTVIGSDGFGYVQHEGRHHKIPQIGNVVIEDDVELGANVTVDRATFGRTVIKCGTKVDNLVQIAHNVTVDEHCIVVAQVGIAGSTTLGKRVMVGGQAGITDHVTIGDQAIIAARSAVFQSLTPGQVVSGAPAIPHKISLKAQAIIPSLPDLRRQVRELQRRIQALEAQLGSPSERTHS